MSTRPHSTEAVISSNKTYLLVRAYVTGIGGICLQGCAFLLRKEPVAFARFEAPTDHLCVHFRHQLPGPNVKTETQRPLNALYEVWSQLQCRGALSGSPPVEHVPQRDYAIWDTAWRFSARFRRLPTFLPSGQTRSLMVRRDCPVVPHSCPSGHSLG
jgi:hypothetical protein